MSETEELKIGKRGEIYTKQKIRTKIGLAPGGEAIVTVEEKRLIAQPKPLSPEELSQLKKEPAKKIETG